MIIFILLLALLPTACCPMATTFTLPMSIYKTRYATPDLTTVLWQESQTHATQAKDCNGNNVPLLAFCGQEDLLNRFINPALAYNDTSSVGQAVFSGKLIGNINLFHTEVNLKDGFFLGNKIAFSQYTLKNVLVHPVSSTGRWLTDEEIKADTALADYLPVFYQKILQNGQPFQDYICNVLCFTAGWAKNWQHFIHADFINISLQTGVQVPPFSVNSCCNNDIFKIPMYQYYNVGIPLEADIEIGLLNWLNIGLEGLATFFISNSKFIQLNPSPTQNTLLPSSCVFTKVHHYPFVYTHAYLEADEILPKISFLCGFTYAKQFKTTYEPVDSEKYPCDIVNKYSLHQPWVRATFNIEFQIDCTANEPSKCSPRLKFLYIQPIYEQATYKTRLLGGELAIDISGNF